MRRRREFISLFGAMAAAWSLAAHAQESATMRATEATRGTLPQIEMPRFRAIKLDLAKLDKLIDEFYQRALKEHDPHSAVVAIKAWERKHDLAGMSGATRIDLTVQPKEAATGYEKIRQAIMRVKYGPDWQPSDGDGNGAAAAPSDDAEPDRNRQ